jgi:hypothetical protein
MATLIQAVVSAIGLACFSVTMPLAFMLVTVYIVRLIREVRAGLGNQ